MDPRYPSQRDGLGMGMRPVIHGTIQVDNVASVLTSFAQHGSTEQQQQQQQQRSPAASVSSDEGPAPLRRNQACLQCRRRKLKCDATRPHCATCQRSHAHLSRTSPKTQHVLTCTYDDVPEAEASAHNASQKKRQRKSAGAGGGGGRKRKNDEHEEEDALDARKVREEKEALERRIAELQSQLSQNAQGQPRTAQPQAQAQPQAGVYWDQGPLSTFGPQIQPSGGMNPDSPTPFLDLLSSAAAAAQGPLQQQQQPQAQASKPWWEQTDEPSPFSSGSNVSGSVPGVAHPQQQRTESYSSSHPSSSGTPAITEPQLTPWKLDVEAPLSGKYEWRAVETVATILENSDPMDVGPTLDALPDISLSGGDGKTAGNSQFLLDLLWPNWPPRLPEPALMSHLIDVYFDTVPGMHRIIHRERFMARMLLPPAHSGFPHVALLHSICAVAAHFTAWVKKPAPGERKDRSTGWCSSDPDFQDMDFTTQHTALATEEIMRAVRTGEKTFDVLRAQIILHRALMYNAAWIEAWSMQGMAARNMLPMGLASRNTHSGYKPATLMDPKDDVEREERRGVLWSAVMTDIASSAMSGWGTSLVMDEIPLPSGTAQWKVGLEMAENPQDLESLDLFTNHPVVDSFVMHVKATILAGRVARFQRRWRDRRMRPNDDLLGMDRAEFKQLDSAISCFIMSMPPALKNPLAKTVGSGKSGIDPDLLAAHMIPHAAAIMLHECFADMEDPDDRSAIRVKQGAHAVFGIFNLVASSSVDLAAVMHPNLGCDAAHAATRSLVIMLRIALNNEEEEVASSIFQELQVLMMTYQQMGERVYLGTKQAEMLQMMINAALSPTYDLFSCHIPFPKHPRHAEGYIIDVSPQSNTKELGRFFVSMLNVKRGFWRMPMLGSAKGSSAHLSSAGVTPESGSERGNTSNSANSTYIATPPDQYAIISDNNYWSKQC